MNSLFTNDAQYKTNISNYRKKDALKAAILFAIDFMSFYLLGKIYSTSLSTEILDWAQSIHGILIIIFILLLVLISKDTIDSIGLTGYKLLNSLLLGLSLSAVPVALQVIYRLSTGESISFNLGNLSLNLVATFIIGAICEEIIFRGYIQTRLFGLFQNNLAASIITAILFLAGHYAVHWATVGFSLSVLTLPHIILIIILHFLCSFTYRKTNCIYGAILLHAIYNIVPVII
jgi:membrane protease YdiL (CAAX protease family)